MKWTPWHAAVAGHLAGMATGLTGFVLLNYFLFWPDAVPLFIAAFWAGFLVRDSLARTPKRGDFAT